jgi:hypothetical protein
MKSVLKPSGPGALLEGRFLITASISAIEKGATKSDRSTEGLRWDARSKPIEVKEVVPNLSLKDSQIN